MDVEAPPQFIEPHQAHFCITKRLEVQQVFKLIFELIFHFFELRKSDLEAAVCSTSAI